MRLAAHFVNDSQRRANPRGLPDGHSLAGQLRRCMLSAPTMMEIALMIRIYLVLAVSCALGACATNAPRLADDAGVAHVSSDGAWQRLDTDSDGAISLDELEAQRGVAL
jgi:hypothetical protein